VRTFLIELLVYSVLVVVYVAVALRLLDHLLKSLYDGNRGAYAVVALALIIGQGVALETITSALVRLLRTRTD
jgi:hypothetical protein